MKAVALIAVSAVLLLTSCTVQKRHYMAGYDIEWFGKTKIVNKNSSLNIKPERVQLTIDKQPCHVLNVVPVNTKRDILLTRLKSKKLSAVKILKPSTCDTIFFKNGSTLPARIVKIGKTQLTYISCDSTNKQPLSVSISQVASVKFSNSGINQVLPKTSNPNIKKAGDTSMFASIYIAVAMVLSFFALLIIAGIVWIFIQFMDLGKNCNYC